MVCVVEGLMLRALCKHLHHLDLPAHAVGDITASPATPGDLLLTSAGPNGFPTVETICRIAKSVGTGVLFITADPHSASGCTNVVVHLSGADDGGWGGGGGGGERGVRLLMGSLYEGALLVLFGMVVVRLEVLVRTKGELRALHTNLG